MPIAKKTFTAKRQSKKHGNPSLLRVGQHKNFSHSRKSLKELKVSLDYGLNVGDREHGQLSRFRGKEKR